MKKYIIGTVTFLIMTTAFMVSNPVMAKACAESDVFLTSCGTSYEYVSECGSMTDEHRIAIMDFLDDMDCGGIN